MKQYLAKCIFFLFKSHDKKQMQTEKEEREENSAIIALYLLYYLLYIGLYKFMKIFKKHSYFFHFSWRSYVCGIVITAMYLLYARALKAGVNKTRTASTGTR